MVSHINDKQVYLLLSKFSLTKSVTSEVFDTNFASVIFQYQV